MYRLREALVRDVGRVVIRHCEFLEDDSPLELKLVLAQRRRRHHIQDDRRGHVKVNIDHPGVVAGVFLGGRGIRLATDAVERLRNVEGGAGRGALEE